MATSNKIVDTRRLAAQGRFGDTEMRNVRGKPSHVTALEAYHMDTTGVQPSASNKSINPMSGLPEYWPKVPQWLQDTYKKTDTYLGGILPGGQDWMGDTSSDSFWWGKESIAGHVLPMHGSGSFTKGKSEQTKIEEQSKDIMTGGMENLQTQYGQYMGDGDPGFIEREQDIRETKLQDVYDVTMGKYDIAGKRIDLSEGKLDIAGEKIAESTNVAKRNLSEGIRTGYGQLKTAGKSQMGKSDFAYSGTIEENVEKGRRKIGRQYASGMEDIDKQYALGMEGIDIGRQDIGLQREDIILGETGAQNIYDVGMTGSALMAEKGEADFMGGLRKQMNQMLVDYQGATGEAYGGGDLLNELNTLFDQYSENV